MSNFTEWTPYAVVALSALSTVASLLPGSGERSGLKLVSHLMLVLAATGLVLALAHPALLPPSSIAMNADGSSQDPRIWASLALGVAACAAVVPALASLGMPALGLLGAVLPGLALGGVMVSFFGFIAHLSSTRALVGIFLGSMVVGSLLGLLPRLLRNRGQIALLLSAISCAVLAGAAQLSLHGARAQEMQIVELGSLDTLGLHIGFLSADAPAPRMQRLNLVVGTGTDSSLFAPILAGGPGDTLTSIADARLLDGPIIVPLVLHEMRRKQTRDIVWVTKGDAWQAGEASVKFTRFRIEQTDSVRMYADLEVTSKGVTEKVSPHWTAHAQGEVPFSVDSKAIGPIAIAGIDADNGRVALMLSTSAPKPSHVALIDVRLRPALPVAWGAAVLAFVGLLLAFVLPGTPARGR